MVQWEYMGIAGVEIKYYVRILARNSTFGIKHLETDDLQDNVDP